MMLAGPRSITMPAAGETNKTGVKVAGVIGKSKRCG